MHSVTRRRGELVQIGAEVIVEVASISMGNVVLHVHKRPEIHVDPIDRMTRGQINAAISYVPTSQARRPITVEWLKEIGFNEVDSPYGAEFDSHYELGPVNICQCESGVWCLDAAPFIEMACRGDVLGVMRLSGCEATRRQPQAAE